MSELNSTPGGFEITDELLGAYADGELDRDTVRQLEAALRDDELMRQRLDDIRYVSSLTRAAVRMPHGAAPAEIEVKSNISSLRVPAARHGSRTYYAIAASLAIVVATGFFWLGSTTSRPGPGWVDDALIYHRQLLGSGRAMHRISLDVQNTDPGYILGKFAPALSFHPAIPDLSSIGFTLEGARMIATAEGWMLYVSYKGDQGYVGLTAIDDGAASVEPVVEAAGVNLISWEQGDIAYAMAGALDAERLAEISLQAQSRIEM